MSRSKRQEGNADAVAVYWATRRWRLAPEVQLVQVLLFLLLLSNVGPDRCLVSTDYGDSETPGPEVLTHKIALALAIHPGDVDGILAFDEADDLGDGIFGWDRDHHVHVVAHHVSLLDPAFFWLSQSAKDSAEVLAQLTV